jgi:hypothetical protein
VCVAAILETHSALVTDRHLLCHLLYRNATHFVMPDDYTLQNTRLLLDVMMQLVVVMWAGPKEASPTTSASAYHTMMTLSMMTAVKQSGG